MINSEPASSAMVQSCMVISDMDRNSPREKSDTKANAFVRAGQRIRGRIVGTILDSTMADSRQVTNRGSLRPATQVIRKALVVAFGFFLVDLQ